MSEPVLRTRVRPVAPTEVRLIVTVMDRESLRGKRDAAIILLGNAGALRAGELAALSRPDVKFTRAGLRLTVRGKPVELAAVADPELDPVTALKAWLKAARIERGAIFRPVAAPGLRTNRDRMSAQAVSAVVAARGGAAGVAGVTGLSLRAGYVTTAKAEGVEQLDIDRFLRVAGVRPRQQRQALRQTAGPQRPSQPTRSPS